MSVYRLSELSGINQSTLANTFSRGTVPSIENLERICEALGFTIAQFFTDGEVNACLSDNEIRLIENYRKLSAELRGSLDELVEKMSDEIRLK